MTISIIKRYLVNNLDGINLKYIFIIVVAGVAILVANHFLYRKKGKS